MSHTPFIVASYLFGTLVLLWAGLTPVIGRRNLLSQLRKGQARRRPQAGRDES